MAQSFFVFDSFLDETVIKEGLTIVGNHGAMEISNMLIDSEEKRSPWGIGNAYKSTWRLNVANCSGVEVKLMRM